MLKISNLTVITKDTKKLILDNINLEFETGKIYGISGQNGSGKSTLAQAIIGNPEYVIRSNSKLIFSQVIATTVSPQENDISVAEDLSFHKNSLQVKEKLSFRPNQIDLKTLTPDQRSHIGIFVSMQYPIEVPGVSLLNYLKLIIEINGKARNLEKLTSKQTLDLIHSKLEMIGWAKDILKRNLNEGMSGGERKKSEILQMLLLDPKLIILDEIDSGLDREALENIIQTIKQFMTKDKTLVVITHQQKILDLLQPNQTIYLRNGKLV